MFPCDTCSTTFADVRLLHQHLLGERHQQAARLTYCYRCPICATSATGTDSLMDHLLGRKHEKNVNKACWSVEDLYPKVAAPAQDVPVLKIESNDEDDNRSACIADSDVASDAPPPKMYRCHICPWQSAEQLDYDRHIEGQSHFQKLVRKFDNVNELWCEDCSCNVSGLKNFSDHLRSIRHKNCMSIKEKTSPHLYFSSSGNSLNGSQSLPSVASPTSGNSATQQHYCDLCKKPISGDSNLLEHNRSAKHVKKMEQRMNERMTAGEVRGQQQTLQQALQNLDVAEAGWCKVSPDPEDVYVTCKACNVNVCGTENWELHAKGQRHKKAVAAQERVMDRTEAAALSTPKDALMSALSESSSFATALNSPSPTPPASRPSSRLASLTSLTQWMSSAIPGMSPSPSLTSPSPAPTVKCSSLLSRSTSTPIGYNANTASPSVAAAGAASLQGFTSTPSSAGTQLSSSISMAAPSVSVTPASSMSVISTPASILSADRKCLVCDVMICGEDNFRIHLQGRKHLKRAANAAAMSPDQSISNGPISESSPFYCGICSVGMTGQESLESHLKGKKHKAHELIRKKQAEWDDPEKAKQLKKELESLVVEDEGQANFPKSCPTCNADMSAANKDQWISHLKGSKHREYEKIWEISKAAQVKDGNVFTAPSEESSVTLEAPTEMSSSGNRMPVYNYGRGYMLIINQEFQNNRKWYREGSDEDVVRLKETFATFGFDIRVEHDLKLKEIYDCLGEVRDVLNANPDRYAHLFVVILSHGKDRQVMALETNLWFPVDDLPEIFSKKACPGLSNRPSIFIINACRGSIYNDPVTFKKKETVQTDGPLQVPFLGKGDSHDEPLEPNKCDYLICYSCTADNPAYRDVKKGSFFISFLCQTIEKEYENMDLEQILKFVKGAFKTRKIRLINNDIVMQMPEETSTLSKNFFFKSIDSGEDIEE